MLPTLSSETSLDSVSKKIAHLIRCQSDLQGADMSGAYSQRLHDLSLRAVGVATGEIEGSYD
jgi:hypothetical protein